MPTVTEENREKPEDVLSQGDVLVWKLADTKEQCCTLKPKYGVLVKRRKLFECETWFVTQSKGRKLRGFVKAVSLLGQCSDISDRNYQMDKLGYVTKSLKRSTAVGSRDLQIILCVAMLGFVVKTFKYDPSWKRGLKNAHRLCLAQNDAKVNVAKILNDLL